MNQKQFEEDFKRALKYRQMVNTIVDLRKENGDSIVPEKFDDLAQIQWAQDNGLVNPAEAEALKKEGLSFDDNPETIFGVNHRGYMSLLGALPDQWGRE